MDGDLVISKESSARPARAGRAQATVVDTELDLSKPSLGERLWLWRLTARADGRRVTLMEAASKLGVDTSTYWALEVGRLGEDSSSYASALAALVAVDEPVVTVPLALRLARRRAGVRLPDVALFVGIGSRPTFYKAERGGDPRVVRYWEARGFDFSRISR